MKQLLGAVVVLYFSISVLYAQDDQASQLTRLERHEPLLPAPKKKNSPLPASSDYQLAPALDSLGAFIAGCRQNGQGTFERQVEPHLQKEIARQQQKFDFSPEEMQVLERFLQALTWEELTSKADDYQEFIRAITTDTQQFQNIYRFLALLKQAHDYDQSHKCNYGALFRSYNPVDWLVFSRQPLEILFWELAIQLWYAGNN